MQYFLILEFVALLGMAIIGSFSGRIAKIGFMVAVSGMLLISGYVPEEFKTYYDISSFVVVAVYIIMVVYRGRDLIFTSIAIGITGVLTLEVDALVDVNVATSVLLIVLGVLVSCSPYACSSSNNYELKKSIKKKNKQMQQV